MMMHFGLYGQYCYYYYYYYYYYYHHHYPTITSSTNHRYNYYYFYDNDDYYFYYYYCYPMILTSLHNRFDSLKKLKMLSGGTSRNNSFKQSAQ
nr:hypothetical protein BaRGS_034737 [Batillaria attramentaria]